MPREALLTRTLVELADNLVEDFDVVDLLTLLADRCVEIVDVADEGPCIDAYRSGLPVVNVTIDEANSRWPRFAPKAADAGSGPFTLCPCACEATASAPSTCSNPKKGS